MITVPKSLKNCHGTERADLFCMAPEGRTRTSLCNHREKYFSQVHGSISQNVEPRKKVVLMFHLALMVLIFFSCSPPFNLGYHNQTNRRHRTFFFFFLASPLQP